MSTANPVASQQVDGPWSATRFEEELRNRGHGYHVHHPFNVMLNSGGASREQIQGWVANRFYYQINLPIKDAAILANCPEREHRRLWMTRILNQDGYGADAGGIETWVRLGNAVGLADDELWSLTHVLPAVRFAVDEYVNFARHQPWQEAVCASLTELFASQIHRERLATWPGHYPWIDNSGLEYFRSRLPLVERDVEHSLRVTLEYFRTRQAQQRALGILQLKLDILWSMLDAIQLRYGLAP